MAGASCRRKTDEGGEVCYWEIHERPECSIAASLSPAVAFGVRGELLPPGFRGKQWRASSGGDLRPERSIYLLWLQYQALVRSMSGGERMVQETWHREALVSCKARPESY